MNIKKTKTIGIRTDEHFLKLLESASKMYNASVIPPFVGLFETRITRPICTGSVS